jgi:uncharacterized protein YecE (DUF72 family)
MRVRVGTSGFSYKEWKGSFYPEDIKADAMLRFYAERFGTVEINNTFYRMPNRELLERWAGEVPDGFAFVLKSPQRITHQKRLLDTAAPDVAHLLEIASVLGDKLGPILFQTPPFLKKDLARLAAFLELLPSTCRAAFEFRHASWFDDEVRGLLRERGAALCAADTDDGEPDANFSATAAWGYLRLRRTDYDDAALDAWAARVRGQAWSEAWVFFKHEDEGNAAVLATRFLERFRAGA